MPEPWRSMLIPGLVRRASPPRRRGRGLAYHLIEPPWGPVGTSLPQVRRSTFEQFGTGTADLGTATARMGCRRASGVQ